MGTIDLVIPLGQGSHWENNEIRYCLRSFAKHCKDLRNVYIVGFLPNFLKNIIHIPCDDPFQSNKDANLIRKVLIACDDQNLSEHFIRCSDDQLLLQNCSFPNPQPLYSLDLKEQDWKNMNRWRNRLKLTYEHLLSQNKTTYHYDTHLPCLYNKQTFKKIMSENDWGVERAGFTINTLYFNNTDVERIPLTMMDKANIECPIESYQDLYHLINGKKYLGYNDKGLNTTLKSHLAMLFPDLCCYEAY